VLKDAASNALYGARGANGVIMITTKKARGQEATISVDAKWGVNSRAMESYDYIKSPAQYYETYYSSLSSYYRSQGMSESAAHAMANKNLAASKNDGGLGYMVYSVPDGQSVIGTNGKLNPNATLGNRVVYNGQEYLLTPDDWEDIAFRSSMRQEYNVSVSGATDRSTFYASFGYLNNEGITENSNMERYTARLKADYQAKKWLKVGANAGYANFTYNSLSADGQGNSSANLFAFTSSVAPIYPLYVRDGQGNIMKNDAGITMYDYGDGMNAGLTRPLLPNANGLADSRLNTDRSEGNAFNGTGFFDILFLKDFKFTFNVGVSLDETRRTTVQNPYFGQFADENGIIGKYHTRDFSHNLQQILNYTKVIGKHNVNVMLGHEYYQRRQYLLYGSTANMFSPDNDELAGAVIDKQSATSYVITYNNEGYFGRAQYDYDGKYFFSASYRRDASSRFHPSHRWGNFWSVGAAWLLNQENWFDAPWVNLLKLKASYGSQGNDNIGNSTIGYYLYTDTYSIENNNGEIAVLFGQKGNPNITWETNTNLNIGTEFGFWNNRLSGSVDFFNRKTSDMLFAFSVPSSLGYSSYYANVGDMVNRGVEVELNADLIRTKNVLWSFNLNLTHVKNEVTYLAPEHKSTTVEGYKGYIDGSYFVGEGLPLYTYYLRSYAGVDPETGASLWYKDVKGDDGKITRTKTSDYTSATRYLHDSAIPSVYGGFSTSVSAYGVDFSISFNYQIGGKVYDSGYASFMSSPYGTTVGTNYHKDILKAWTPENKGSDIPRLQYGDQYTTSVSDRFLTDASYLNISNINVGYTLPSKITQKFGVQKLRVYLACDNVVYWSKRQGLDPRYSFTGATNFSNYSPIRTISGGVTVQF
uniref:SusC/RagA family TonB-linked outer membrane protein n=1 Tax=Alistipes finegoldii TaxID=214856 RepID=UPI003AB0C0D4